MSDILKSILGLVVKKARSATASYLSDKDLTDESLRGIIVSEIDDIKSSLRGLSRQTLNGSLSFLKEGISRMGLAVRDTSTRTQNVQAAIIDAAEEFVAGASASTSQQTEQRTVGEASLLSNFKIVSQERWVCAKESFKTSREQATIAFGNTALSIEDRIMACKLRIASSILEKFLDDPEAGAQDCLLYLQELHDLPAVRETFTVHIDGGFKSRFNRTKRSEIVESVTAINNILSDFILKFTRVALSRSFEWPVIQLTDSKRPRERIIVHVGEMRGKARLKAQEEEEENRIKQMRKRWPNCEFSYELIFLHGYCRLSMAVNSAGRIYWHNFPRSKVLFMTLRMPKVDVVFVDIGPNDDMYTLQLSRTIDVNANRAVNYYLRLVVHDKKDTPVREITKGLPPTERETCWVMRVLENKIVLCNEFGKVFILACDMQDQQLNKECSFSLPTLGSTNEKPEVVTTRHYMCATNKREVIIARPKGNEVYICPITDEGQMERIIPVPLKQHETESRVCGVAFDATHEEEIVVLRNIPNEDSFWSDCHIEVYSRNGDLRDFHHLPGLTHGFHLLSNPKGIVALVRYSGYDDKINFHHLVGKVFLGSNIYKSVY
jgi:hypothetical protein